MDEVLVKERSLLAPEQKLQCTVDQVLEEYVGSFGFSQIVQVFLVSLVRMFDSQSTIITIFADAQPDSWHCIRPECSSSSQSVCGLKPGSWEWNNGNASTTVAEWGLVCDRRFLAALPASFYFLGSMIGSPLYSHLADSFLGRKRSVLLSCLLTSGTTYLTSVSPNIWIYSFLRFTNGFSRSGIVTCCQMLATEAVGRQWHGQVGQYGFFFFAAGFLSIPIIAYPTRESWRNLYKLISFLPLVYAIFILLPFVLESPRWLLARGRSEEALELLKRHTRVNGKEFPSNISLMEPDEDKRMWRTEWAAKRMPMVMITGLGIGFLYYGIQFNVENISFNLYFTVAVNAMMEIPAVFIGGVLLSFMERRILFSFSAFLAGTLCIFCAVLATKNRNGNSLPQLMIQALGSIAASTAYNVLYVYCVELFPKNLRNIAVSLLRQGLMLGASLSPLLVVFGRTSPSIAFCMAGSIGILSGLLSLWIPETMNVPLYEDLKLEDGERCDCITGDLEREVGKSNTGQPKLFL